MADERLDKVQQAVREWELAYLEVIESRGDLEEAETPELVAVQPLWFLATVRINRKETRIRVSLFSGIDPENEDEVQENALNPGGYVIGYIDVLREENSGSVIGYHVEGRGNYTMLNDAIEAVVQQYVATNQRHVGR